MVANPFTPSFGVSPPLTVGRGGQIDDFRDALQDGPGAPGRATLVTGIRGSGKTVLLNAFEQAARELNWLVVSATVRPGFVAEMTRTSLPRLLHHVLDDATASRITGLTASAGPVGAGGQREYVDRFPIQPSLRSEIEALSEALDVQDRGLLITLDEVHHRARDELREVTQAVQHAFREGRPVAVAAAGLPSSINDLLDDDVLTFLRRAERVALGPVARDDVVEALASPVRLAGRAIGDDAAALAADGTDGYPFLIQLVGHQSWNVHRDSAEITIEDARVGVDGAIRRVGRLVHEPSLRELSDVDRSFLTAMAVDDGASRMADVASRLSVDANYAGQYRLRLIAAEVVRPAGWGRVDFTLPYLRTYLREHAAREAFDDGR